MKKIFNLFAVAIMGGLVLASCDNDDTTNEIATHGLQVTSAKTSFEAKGGTQSISVAATPTSAYSNDDWATVAISGNTVNVTAAQNNDRQTRHTTIVVKSSPLDSAIVNVDQDGLVFSIASAGISLNDNGTRRSIYVKHNIDMNISTKDDWLQASLNNDSISISASENTTGSPRRGWIYYTCGNIKDSIQVMQFDPEKEVLGDYFLNYYDNGWKYFTLSLSKESDNSYAMRFTSGGLASYGWVIPVTLNTDVPGFTFTNLSNIGPFITYKVLLMVLIYRGSEVRYSLVNSLTATASWEVDEDGYELWPLTVNEDGYEFYGFRLGLSTDGTTYAPNEGGGSIFDFDGAIFEKIPAGNAKSFGPKKAPLNKLRKSSSSAKWKAPELLPNKTVKAL